MFEFLNTKEIPNTGYNRHFKFLKELIFIVPESLKEQKAIAQILSDMDAEITQLESKKEKYQAIKQGMMQELLTGKTRLK
jgi:type I restriction enzyme S subunit